MRLGLIAIIVTLCTVAFAEDTATLKVRVFDEAGKSVAFRAYVLCSPPPVFSMPQNVVTYRKKSTSLEEHIIVDGVLSCTVPAGGITLRVERGLEYKISCQLVPAIAGETVERDITLKRWADPNAEGWYSGDMHIHRDPSQLALICRAEDLNAGVNIGYWNDIDEFAKRNLPAPASAIEVVDERLALGVAGQEVERLKNGWGAILFVGNFKPVSAPDHVIYPIVTQYAREVRAQGGFIDIEKPVWLHTPVCAALGLVDSIGVVHNHFHRDGFLPFDVIEDCMIPPLSLTPTPLEAAEFTLELYYHLLNCGFRIPVSGGSASGVMPSQVGFARTYAHIDGPFSFEAWLAAIKAGKSFATNAPLLNLTADGKPIGETLTLVNVQQTLSVHCEARTAPRGLRPTLAVLEIVHNGNVIARVDSERGAENLTIDQEFSLGPGWVAARCFTHESPTQLYAQTSPIYLTHEGKRGLQPESGAFYKAIVEKLIAQVEADGAVPDAYQREEMLVDLRKALAVYQAVVDSKE